MIQRLFKYSKSHSFFLFGPRGVGKTHWMRESFSREQTEWIDLLKPSVLERFQSDLSAFDNLLKNLSPKITWIVIDEIQKLPELLDSVHSAIENGCKQNFALTGSSARKLKRSKANLLAGRALWNNLHTFSFIELGNTFNLERALRWGMLPKVWNESDEEIRNDYLDSYLQTYLNEEILAEQIIRNLQPFRKFLRIAAQSNTKLLNYEKIGRDVGADGVTIKNYFLILEDTLLGRMLYPFQTSFRKRLTQAPKFYFFDTGLVRSLQNLTQMPLQPSTSSYGDLFEQFVVNEFFKLNDYFKRKYEFSYIRTKDDAEIDLVIERPGLPILAVEIKSTKKADLIEIKAFETLAKDLGEVEMWYLSQDDIPQMYNQVKVIHWQAALRELFQ